MSRRFRAIIIYPAWLIILCFPFINRCNRSESLGTAEVIYINRAKSYLPDISTPHNSPDDISSGRKEGVVHGAKYDILIPGRTVKSAEFIPGEEYNISLDGASLHVPADGVNKKVILSISGLAAGDLPPIPPRHRRKRLPEPSPQPHPPGREPTVSRPPRRILPWPHPRAGP